MIAHLVTGGTGFVGSALIVELLRQTDAMIVGIVRPRDGASATERLREAVHGAAVAYGASAELLAAIAERCVAVDGDVSQEGCGVLELPALEYDQFWHSAASLRFEDRYAEEIYQTNKRGTEQALNLAARARVRHFNYFSTAYVAGRMEGKVPEALHMKAQPNNHYEASKLEAEALVSAERRFGVRVLRPSIIIGHSETLEATNFSGMYGFLRKLYGFSRLMGRTQQGLMQRHSLRLKGDAAAPCDLVPVDRVVHNALVIAAASDPLPGEPLFFHLTNPAPPRLAEVVRPMFDMLEMSEPTWVDSEDGLAWLDSQFNSRIDFYRSYLQGQRRFDRSRIESLIGQEPEHPYVLDDERLRAYYGWYLERLEAERSDLPATR